MLVVLAGWCLTTYLEFFYLVQQVVWVTHGRTQHMAFLLETKGDRMYVRWASNMLKEWVDASNVTTDVEGRGVRRRGTSVVTAPLAEGRPQRMSVQQARSKLDSLHQPADVEDDDEEEDGDKEFDWFPGKSKDQDDEEAPEEVKRAKKKGSKLENQQESFEPAAVADESATPRLSNDQIPTKTKKNKRKRGSDSAAAEDKSVKMLQHSGRGETTLLYDEPMKDDAVAREKPAGTKTRHRGEIAAKPKNKKAQKMASGNTVELVPLVAGAAVAKVCRPGRLLTIPSWISKPFYLLTTCFLIDREPRKTDGFRGMSNPWTDRIAMSHGHRGSRFN